MNSGNQILIKIQNNPPWKTLSTKQVSKKVYSEIIEKQKRISSIKYLWESELNIEINDDDWARLFININSLSIDTKLRCHQFKLLNHIVTTNVTRSKYAAVIPLCSFCLAKQETLVHLYYECEKVLKMWNLLRRWCRYHYSLEVEFDLATIILNNYKGPQRYFVNCIILIMKYHIYATKCKNEVLNFQAYVTRMIQMEQIEALIALRNGKLEIHKRKWKLYLN